MVYVTLRIQTLVHIAHPVQENRRITPIPVRGTNLKGTRITYGMR
jgi:hypothetical protein